MDAISYSFARKNLVQTMEKVCDDHSPIIVTRKNSRAVVIMSLEDFNAFQETAYLLRSPANAERLRQSIKQTEEGKIVEHDIIEIEEKNKENS
ncbi:MAG TPA: type II toxin-antitoxin system prevent-host-death family antitoxin [Gammaproteobacteria bacterium]|nr:type II toxin-antitoxin system prevent-host-death family antitoxin [Gammaproteobacteria bacterium]